MNTLTRVALAESIYSAVGLSRNESADLLESALEHIRRSLAVGETVKITGFGTFSVRQKGRRIGRNPKTGIEVPILPRRVLTFRPSHILRDAVDGGIASVPPHAS
jgi:integration host factor subunit alpha